MPLGIERRKNKNQFLRSATFRPRAASFLYTNGKERKNACWYSTGRSVKIPPASSNFPSRCANLYFLATIPCCFLPETTNCTRGRLKAIWPHRFEKTCGELPCRETRRMLSRAHPR